ncbi:transglycosylase SLT domain-containing protein [Nitratifractor sp.]
MKPLRLTALFWLLLVGMAGASIVPLRYDAIHRLPAGVAKDYYIWRYVTLPSTSKKEALRLLREISFVNPSLQKAYRAKAGIKLPLGKRGPKKRLSPQERRALAARRALTRKILSSPDPLRSFEMLPAARRLEVFLLAGRTGRKRIDHVPDRSEWETLVRQPAINRAIDRILRERLPGFSRALAYPLPSDHAIRPDRLMRMGFRALEKGEAKRAHRDFLAAARKFTTREEADRALFWAWKAGDDREALRRLAKSWDISLYTLAARDALKLPYDLGITPKLPEGHVKGFDLYDPVAWEKLKKQIFAKGTDLHALARRFAYKEAVGYYTYIEAKASRDKKQFFPMPYRGLLKSYPLKRQAIVYAIARQESRFVPASLSRSFALGLMQIMPFLVDDLARKRHERIDYDALFRPEVALRYANDHLDYLTKWLHHPLFVAYAYNAGIGYTRRLMRRRDLFRKQGRYEPWLSLEKIANFQANNYGKKVLANYVIYLNKLGYRITLSELVSVLNRPEFTDEFRR